MSYKCRCTISSKSGPRYFGPATRTKPGSHHRPTCSLYEAVEPTLADAFNEPPPRPKALVLAQKMADKGFEDVAVAHDGGVVFVIGNTRFHVNISNDGKHLNVRVIDGLIVIYPTAANSIDIKEERF